ncbi:hypothetical protein EUGRSUZ_L02070 [Eucalyptus grandis]|uniref:Uncharacterized protein n=1 Tax=Eucalyptus grandis TaxID=71139 RepID=A0A058ZRP7_EUCGR|nr:hypothetical protein EUGRSUZ_L02070 [Eucalyptus grandis]
MDNHFIGRPAMGKASVRGTYGALLMLRHWECPSRVQFLRENVIRRKDIMVSFATFGLSESCIARAT